MLSLLRLAFRTEAQIKKYLLVVLLLEIISVFLLFQLNSVYGTLYEGIQTYNIPAIWGSIWKFSAFAGVLVFIGAYAGVYVNLLSFAIREGLTKYVILHSNLRRYSIETGEETTLQIPEPRGQRIQEDLGRFGSLTTELGVALLRAGLKLPIFLGVVVSLTHWYTGVMLLLAVVGGTYLTKIVGTKLVGLQAVQETNEAKFRENTSLSAFGHVKTQFLQINRKLKMLLLAQNGLDQIFVLLPFILLMPLYVAKVVTMGAFMQSVNALGKVVESLLVLIDNRQVLVNIQSVLLRLKFLRDIK